jgi:hypothetical protein
LEPLYLPNSLEEEWVLQTNLSEEKNSILIVSAKEEGSEAKEISGFNQWALWYKSLPFNSRKKEVFNFIIYP